MIYIDRSSVPIPEGLTSPRAHSAHEQIARLLTSSKEHLEQTRIRFDVDIWRSATPALLELFHGKCAYCESKIFGFNHIEHFRPKGGVEELDGTRSHYYYAWLAYEWDNLLISCARCYSQRGKTKTFPVKGNRARLLASVEECRKTEEYMVLDPCFDRPEDHLSFIEFGQCVGLTERGRITIEILGLNDMSLCEARRRAWQNVRQHALLILSISQVNDPKNKQALLDLWSNDKPYAAVARAALLSLGPEILKLGTDLGDQLPPERLPEIIHEGQRPRAADLAPDVADEVVAMSERRRQYSGRAKLPSRAYETIRRIEIRNFKAIDELEFDLRVSPPGEEETTPALMLLGENATGKSSILEAVALALLGTDEIKKLGLHARTFVRRIDQPDSPDEPDKPAEIVIHFDDDQPEVRLTIDSRSDHFEGDPRPATVLLGYGSRRFFSDRRRVHRANNPSARVRTLFDPLAVISNPTSWLMNSDQASFNAAIRALRELLLLPEESHVSRPKRGQRRGAEIMFEITGRPEPLRRLSEGYKTTIATGVDIMREMLTYWPDLEGARGVVLIDELDTHLHPRWKMRIVGRLRRAMPGVQFIATTHDPLCLRGLIDGEAQVLRRNQNGQIEQVPDLPNVRGLSVEQLLNSEFFGLFSTEDPKFEEDMGRYVALATKHEPSPTERSELERYRGLVHDTVTLGLTPEGRLVQAAASQYLLEQRHATARQQSELKQTAVRRIIELWKSIPTGDQEQ